MNPDEQRRTRAAEQQEALAEQRRIADGLRHEQPPNVIGTPLRDAAVDPQPGDHLAPVNAGKSGPEGDPHGPNVVSPEIPGSLHHRPPASPDEAA